MWIIEVNQHLCDTVSTKTLHKEIPKPSLSLKSMAVIHNPRLVQNDI